MQVRTKIQAGRIASQDKWCGGGWPGRAVRCGASVALRGGEASQETQQED